MTVHFWSDLATFIGAILSVAALALACIAEYIDTQLLDEAKADIEAARKKLVLTREASELPQPTPLQVGAMSPASIEDAAYDKQCKTHKKKYNSQKVKAAGRVCAASAIFAVSLGTYLRPDPYAGCSRFEHVTQEGRVVEYECPAVPSTIAAQSAPGKQ